MYNQMLQNGLLEGVLEGRKAFGMGIKNREYVAFKNFRYKFNGKETDSETVTQDYGFRIYNPALGKFLSVDPLTNSYPWYTPYQFAGNKPIQYLDIDGLEEVDYNKILKKDGSVEIVVSRTENTTANSNNGVLIIHNKVDNIDYYQFEYNEINELFNISGDNGTNISDKIVTGPSGASDYKFLLSNPDDIVPKQLDNTYIGTGTKQVALFRLSENALTPITTTPNGGTASTYDITKGVTSVQNDILSDIAKEVKVKLGNENQSANDVTKIQVDFDNNTKQVFTDSFKEVLQNAYPNAKIEYTENYGGASESAIGTIIEGKEVTTTPTPIQ